MTPWMETLAEQVRERFSAEGIQLTLGGEPTLVPVNPEGSEWTITADGPTKLPIARRLAEVFQRTVWPGGTLLYCPGKLYAGEVNPRWALRLLVRTDGSPLVTPQEGRPAPPSLTPPRPEQAIAWLERLGDQLGVKLRPLPLRDPLDGERHVWAAPLTASEPSGTEDSEDWVWQAGAWPLADELRELSGAPGPAGLRLPLAHFPPDIPRQVLTLEVEPGGWELFLPPPGGTQRTPAERDAAQRLRRPLAGAGADRGSRRAGDQPAGVRRMERVFPVARAHRDRR